ncbi:hypothetical protein BKA58DRAFT_460103 [Alternaria rosae]|uniref:uncharacterized protein n=1 Tax=Alternaria rosae TaxID=1187941 RepID=UPI001E8EE48C|nr:uncharacterized protein BKA58DRAFT_460103 [Alternaria rosae]KAH6866394.1 hypothetical protein BKA58DRAFT_460103 [Alternaria rosae]
MSFPTESPARYPRDYADPNWVEFAQTIDYNARGRLMEDQHKKTIEAIAAIADQIRWTTSQMKPEYWPDKETLVAKQFLVSNLVQLQMVCYEPLKAIREHIINVDPNLLDKKFRTKNWLMPRQVREAESPVDRPFVPPSPPPPKPDWRRDKTLSKEEKEKKRKEEAEQEAEEKTTNRIAQELKRKEDVVKEQAANDKFLKGEKPRIDRHKNIMANQGEHVDYFQDDGDEEGFTWRDAIRSALRTYDAAYMEVDRHHRLLKQTKKRSGWSLDRLDVLLKKRGIPTRSNQELLIELALPVAFGGPPTPLSQATMANWKTAADIQNTLNIHLGRFIKQEIDGRAPTNTRHWTTDFTRKYNHASGAEPAMFFVCTHEYTQPNSTQPIKKWIVGGSTPLTGPKKYMFAWADELYKAVREQGLGSDFVAKVKAANDAQQALELRLLGNTTDPSPEEYLSARKAVIRELTNDSTHQRVLSTHMTPSADYPPTIEHLITYDWERQCSWAHQCAEGLAACQCFTFDQGQDEANRPESSRVAALRLSTPGKTLKKKRSNMDFEFKR